MILIAYDGSADAQAAIERAGQLMKGETAAVLCVWERFIDVMTRVGTGMPVGEVDYQSLDRANANRAREQAQEGAERARRAGLEAEPRIRAREGRIAETILAEANELGADAVVLGTRGLTGLKSLFLGSV
ncbi:MAG: universal stress protein, partial [Solirubrobacterales bacterium]|nr:universal stress protein [Solirubrobacterales bacterium]